MNQIKINEYPLANSAQIFLQNVQKGEEVPQIQILCKESESIYATWFIYFTILCSFWYIGSSLL